MELLEGIKSRKSIRGFRPDPVSTDVLIELLETATRAPSSVNLQPWEFVIIKNGILDLVKRECVEQYRLGKKPNPDVALAETGLQGIYKDRQVYLAKQIFALVGITKDDNKRLQEYWETMYSFYGAPAVIVITIDRMLTSEWPLIDIGLVSQTIALAAVSYGLGTCIMRAIVDYADSVRKIAGIPANKKMILGIAIGYPDWNHPLNQLKTVRENIYNITNIT
jgi:nitroreductase